MRAVHALLGLGAQAHPFFLFANFHQREVTVQPHAMGGLGHDDVVRNTACKVRNFQPLLVGCLLARSLNRPLATAHGPALFRVSTAVWRAGVRNDILLPFPQRTQQFARRPPASFRSPVLSSTTINANHHGQEPVQAVARAALGSAEEHIL